MQNSNLAEVLDNNMELKVHVNPHYENISLINKKKLTLRSIRLALSIEKLSSPFIKREKLLTIVNNEKAKTQDQRVNEELDKIFGEYFSKKDIPTPKDIWNENSPILTANVEAKVDKVLSLEEMESIVAMDDYQDKGRSNGTSKIMAGPFGSAHKSTEVQQ